MARRTRRDDEDALDPTEAADVITEDEAEELDGDVDADVDGDDEPDDDAFDAEDDVDAEAAGDGDEVELPIAGFDEDAEDVPVVLVDDDDDDSLDSIGEGEFVCRSCFMAKRESALADAKRILCRDCA